MNAVPSARALRDNQPNLLSNRYISEGDEDDLDDEEDEEEDEEEEGGEEEEAAERKPLSPLYSCTALTCLNSGSRRPSRQKAKDRRQVQGGRRRGGRR